GARICLFLPCGRERPLARRALVPGDQAMKKPVLSRTRGLATRPLSPRRRRNCGALVKAPPSRCREQWEEQPPTLTFRPRNSAIGRGALAGSPARTCRRGTAGSRPEIASAKAETRQT